MSWIKEVLSDAKAILLAPVTNILCIAGVLLLIISFADYDKLNGLTLHGQMHTGTTITGLLLVLIGALLLYRTSRTHASVHLNYEKGVEIKRASLTIRIQKGEIQSIPTSNKNTAIVLPANTAFVDDCATDKRTAMGAFFLEHFPDKVAALPSIFLEVLSANGAQADKDGQYHAGTTIMLPETFAKPAKVVITASTIRKSGAGIASTPHVICSCVEEILKCTADRRVDTVYLPILGSGHGGVDRGIALLFLILAVLHFSKTYHHIKLIQVVIHPKDIDSLNQSKELALIQAL